MIWKTHGLTSIDLTFHQRFQPFSNILDVGDHYFMMRKQTIAEMNDQCRTPSKEITLVSWPTYFSKQCRYERNCSSWHTKGIHQTRVPEAGFSSPFPKADPIGPDPSSNKQWEHIQCLMKLMMAKYMIGVIFTHHVQCLWLNITPI